MIKTVKTEEGEVRLLPPPPELLRAIRAFLPFGLLTYKRARNGAKYGIVTQCGEKEIRGVAAQMAPQKVQEACFTVQALRMLVANSLSIYLRNGFSGLMMPCPYLRDESDGRMEPGVTYIAFPSARGRESQEFPDEPWFDVEFGHGFFQMMMHFVRAERISSEEMHISLFSGYPPESRPFSTSGVLDMSFMLVGPHLVYLRPEIVEQELGWKILRRKGITEMFHLPSVPVTISEADLPSTKG